jgi:hypothetical protein
MECFVGHQQDRIELKNNKKKIWYMRYFMKARYTMEPIHLVEQHYATALITYLEKEQHYGPFCSQLTFFLVHQVEVITHFLSLSYSFLSCSGLSIRNSKHCILICGSTSNMSPPHFAFHMCT